jgi:hypothetical protein
MTDLKCPRCGSWATWSCYGGIGTRGYAGCGDTFGTRVFTSVAEAHKPRCEWEGEVERGPSGTVFIVGYSEEKERWKEIRLRDETIGILESFDAYDMSVAKRHGMPEEYAGYPSEYLASEIIRLKEEISLLDESWDYDAQTCYELGHIIDKLEEEIAQLKATNKTLSNIIFDVTKPAH